MRNKLLFTIYWATILVVLVACGKPLSTLEFNKLICDDWNKSLKNRSGISFTYSQLFRGLPGSDQGRKSAPLEEYLDGEGYMVSYKKMRAEIESMCREL